MKINRLYRTYDKEYFIFYYYFKLEKLLKSILVKII